jgi:hypothetical protein
VKVGRSIARKILRDRANDGSDVVEQYIYSGNAGLYAAVSTSEVQPAGPNWGQITPFVMDDITQFTPDPPPDITSPEYAASYNRVKALGAADSSVRTDDQTEVGYFWSYDSAEIGTPIVMYNQALQQIGEQQGNSFMMNLRLFAIGNASMADAGIAAWNTKYLYDFWRPVTGIHQGDQDGNPLTAGDPNWQPLGGPDLEGFTPNFPSYVSGHATFGGALFQVLRRFYGTDNLEFSLMSDVLPGVTRSYGSFTQAQNENAISREYLGVHWDFDDNVGMAMGVEIGDTMMDMEPQMVA